MNRVTISYVCGCSVITETKNNKIVYFKNTDCDVPQAKNNHYHHTNIKSIFSSDYEGMAEIADRIAWFDEDSESLACETFH